MNIEEVNQGENISERMLKTLNEALAADPTAIERLVEYRVSCNDRLADHPHVVVQDNVVASGNSVGMMGILNGILSAAGLPKIAAQWETPDGLPIPPKLIGFCLYKPKV